jgi:DDE family transposase
MDLTTLFCDVDDFFKIHSFNQQTSELSEQGKQRRNRQKSLSPSEIMTIVIYFHASGYRNFKAFYLNQVCPHLHPFFPKLLSYNRFVEIIPTVLLPLCSYLTSRLDEPTGISYIDSTKIAVCGNKRISRNKVFYNLGKIGKTTMGWFFGFKLHLITNENGGLIAVKITTGNVDDRAPVLKMADKIKGKLFGDKGYISKKLFEKLFSKGLQLITTVKKNMKNKLLPFVDKLLLRKRSIIETINDQLKNISQIEHTRHRSVSNFMVNLLCVDLFLILFKKRSLPSKVLKNYVKK